jgi:hypothetical protein
VVVAVNPSVPQPPAQHRLADLIVRVAEGDLLDVEALNFGPGNPATAALEAERGPRPDDAPGRERQ